MRDSLPHFDEMYTVRDFVFDLHFEEKGNETFSKEIIEEVKRGFGQMFYIVDREEMTFRKPEDVPNIFYQVSVEIYSIGFH